jgi:hypothetical protein
MVRIRFPPAASQQTFGSSQDDAHCLLMPLRQTLRRTDRKNINLLPPAPAAARIAGLRKHHCRAEADIIRLSRDEPNRWELLLERDTPIFPECMDSAAVRPEQDGRMQVRSNQILC